MSKENFQELKSEMETKVKKQLTTGDAFFDFIITTMNSFVYRYVETPSTGKITSDLSGNLCVAKAKEPQILEALKALNPKTKKGIIELAKSYAKKEGPEVLYEIGTDIMSWSPRNESGKIKVWAKVDWAYPDFNDNQKIHKKEETFEFDDLMFFRKKYALVLESVCEVF